MTRKLTLTLIATEEVTELLGHVSSQSPEIARKIRVQLEDTLRDLAEGLLHGRTVRLASGVSAHRWPVSRWVIYYQRSDEELLVLRIVAGARRSVEE